MARARLTPEEREALRAEIDRRKRIELRNQAVIQSRVEKIRAAGEERERRGVRGMPELHPEFLPLPPRRLAWFRAFR